MRLCDYILVILVIFNTRESYSQQSEETKVNRIQGNEDITEKIDANNPSVTLQSFVSINDQKIFRIEVDLKEGHALQIESWSDNPSEKFPLWIYIEQDEYMELVQLPAKDSGNASTISHTLCPTRSSYLQLEFSTHSQSHVYFISTVTMKQYELFLDEKLTNITVSKTQSQVLYFNMSDIEEVLVKVDNHVDSPQCNLVAIHPADTCPFSFLQDMENHLKTGLTVDYQTMMGRAVMLISKSQKSDYGTSGFNIYIVGIDSEECTVFETDRMMREIEESSLIVEVATIKDDRFLSTLITVVCYILMCSIGMMMIILGEKYNIELIGNFDAAQIKMKRAFEGHRYKVYENGSLAASVTSVEEPQQISVIGAVNGKINGEMYRAPSVESDDFQNEFEVERRKRINEKNLTTRTAKNKAKSREYSWMIVTMGLYYAIPVIQLVLLSQSFATVDGNRDLCYFNYECQYPWGIIQDYGNVFSNFGYVFLGLFFTILVAYRRYKYRIFRTYVSRFTDQKYGIPEQFGIFNALGIALILEGLLSASYHICPTRKGFQFDTTFMFVIAILLYLKVYQFRHPDVVQSARSIFLLLGVALLFESLGYYVHSIFYYITFILVYLGIVISFLLNIYWNGDNPGVVGTVKHMSKRFHLLCRNPRKLRKISWLFLVPILANCGLAVYILMTKGPEQDLSTDMLMIFMMNMGLYLAYYVVMKMFYYYVRKELNERITWKTWIYFILANAFAWPSLYFFNKIERGSGKTPALSRELNKPCTVGIFDSHDLWHFLSASALFFLYLFVLTLEDDNVDTPREVIQIF